MPNLTYGLDPILREVAQRFDDLCRQYGALYTIEQDTHNEQGYVIRNNMGVEAVRAGIEEFLVDKWVALDVNEGREPYFKFTIKPLYEYPEPVQMLDLQELLNSNSLATVKEDDSDQWLLAYNDRRVIPPVVIDRAHRVVDGLPIVKALSLVGGINGRVPVVYEDQLKGPTKAYSRKQAAFRSNFGKLRVFGRVVECKQGDILKLKKDLLAHDNSTVIPAGAEVEVVDGDPSLPDIKYNGTIINVDMEKLTACISEDIGDRITRRLDEMGPPSIIVKFGEIGGESPFKSEGCQECGAPTPGATQGCQSCMGNTTEVEQLPQWDRGVQNEALVETLNKLRAGEIVSAIQYELFSVTAPSLNMHGLTETFIEHEEHERKHARRLAERIHELEGHPLADLREISARSPYQVQTADTPESMVTVLLEQEQIAVESYREALRLCSEDSTTRLLLEEILRDEEEHLTDMRSMLGR